MELDIEVGISVDEEDYIVNCDEAVVDVDKATDDTSRLKINEL